MPKVTINGQTVTVRWLKAWDKQILLIGRTFKKKGGFVDWKTAFEEGYFKGMPALKFQDYSHRFTNLKARKRPGYAEKAREYNKLHKSKQSDYGIKIRNELFRSESLNPIRKKHECLPRELWTDEQHGILKTLILAHPRGKSQIDWEGVMTDMWLNLLPKKYQKNLSALRKYYHTLLRLENPNLLKKRRKEALNWRNENKSRYLKNSFRRRKKITQVTHEYLLQKIPLYK